VVWVGPAVCGVAGRLPVELRVFCGAEQTGFAERRSLSLAPLAPLCPPPGPSPSRVHAPAGTVTPAVTPMMMMVRRAVIFATAAVAMLLAPPAVGQSCSQLTICQADGVCGNGCTCPSGESCEAAHDRDDGTSYCVKSQPLCSLDNDDLFGGKWFCEYCSCPAATYGNFRDTIFG